MKGLIILSKLKDLTGQHFGRLTVIERAEKNDIHGNARWICRCTCGAEVIVNGTSLIRGHTQSCGCLHREITSKLLTKHGMRNFPLYKIWKGMTNRCNNPNNSSYPRYGGREIKVCERWLDFQNFYDDVSKLEHFGEEGYTLDRIDNDGDYTPENVRFADNKTQARNKRNNVIVEYEGVEMPLAEAAEKSGISYKVLQQRYNRGDRGEKLFRPVAGR